MTGKLISILGSRDLTGTTTLAINLSFLLNKLGQKKVLLLDFDFSCLGDLAYYLKEKNPCSSTDLFPIIHKQVSQSMLDGFIPRHPKGIYTMQVFDGQKGPEKLDPQSLNKTLNLLTQHFDYVVLDSGATWTGFHLTPFLGSSLLYLTTLPDTPLILESKKRILRLCRSYVPREKIILCINRTSEKKVDVRMLGLSLEDIRWFLLPDAGGEMSEAQGNGLPLVLHDVRNSYTTLLEKQVQEEILGKELPSFDLEKIPQGELSSLVPFWMSTTGTNLSVKPSSEPLAAATTERNELKSKILKSLLKVVDFKGINIGKHRSKKDDEALQEKTTEAILQIINSLGEDQIPADQRKQLVSEVLNEALGLGPLESLLADKTISEIMINGRDQIFVEKNGKLTLSPLRFSSLDQLNAIIERIVAPIGRRIDESVPLVDARLSDGSRVNIIIAPLSLVGPVVTIRRFSETPLQVNDLVKYGSLTKGMAAFLDAAIKGKLNIIVSGGTGSGKTTLLNVLSSFIPEGDRIVTIEDAAELKLHQTHVVSLETRPPNIEGKGDISIRALVKNSLRMRPDRIVVGECRGGEALDMLQAMNTGHDGSLTTLHSNSPRDCIARLETLVMYAGVPLPSRAIRAQIASAVHLIVQLNRLTDGSRRITRITELTGMEGDIVTLQDIFVFDQKGLDGNRKVIGEHKPTGFIPQFMDGLTAKGIPLSREYFKA